jgi:tetratricopeptide (TPR) repeat protein
LVAQSDYDVAGRQRAFGKAETVVRRALDSTPHLADAHIAMGDTRRLRDFDWRGAEASYTQAIAVNPSSEAAHRLYGLLLATLGRRSEALREAKRAHAVDPLCLVVGTSTAWVHYLARDSRTAIEQCGITFALEPAFLPARRLLAASLQQADRLFEASAALEKALTQSPDDPASLAWLAHVKAAVGDRARASALADRVRAYDGPSPLSGCDRAISELAIGDPARALAALERAYDDRDPAVANVATEPRFAALHAEPRFTQLVDRLNLKLQARVEDR